MVLLGKLIQKGIKIRESLEQKYGNALELQKSELLKLLITARNTKFGSYYEFENILDEFSKRDGKTFFKTFRDKIPVHDYDAIFSKWWSLSREGKNDVCWPGKVKYFALSSGTSSGPSKFIPVTKDMLKSIKKTSVRQLLTLSQYSLPPSAFSKGALMLGGSTNLKKMRTYYDADLSGITASNIPFWFQHFYKPGKKISKNDNWEQKLEMIVEQAPKWDISFVVGVPAWIQILFNKIIETYHLENIHDMWPNLAVFVHGGVAFEPYHNSFKKLIGKEIKFIETYLASEGFLAYQARPDTNAMKLVLNNGIFYEFIPFNEKNFDSSGNLISEVETLLIDEVEEQKPYALLITTCAGAWRYLIGDVIKFTNLAECEMVIVGRTKHFLSICGEHLSVDNMNKAVSNLEKERNLDIAEFTVAGMAVGDFFAHRWYVACDTDLDAEHLSQILDKKLIELNDDYGIERQHALKYMEVIKVPLKYFYDWMKIQGKLGGQYKFPRVIRGQSHLDWQAYLIQNGVLEPEFDIN